MNTCLTHSTMTAGPIRARQVTKLVTKTTTARAVTKSILQYLFSSFKTFIHSRLSPIHSYYKKIQSGRTSGGDSILHGPGIWARVGLGNGQVARGRSFSHKYPELPGVNWGFLLGGA
jgi:hypothetical protein